MNLFDDMGSKGSRKLTEAEGYLGILLVAIAADGEIADEEVSGFIDRLARLSIFENWDSDDYQKGIDRILKMINKDGMPTVAARCVEVLPEELVLTAWANVCDLVCADGVIDENEQAYLNELCENLGVKPENAKTILKVMMIKNRR